MPKRNPLGGMPYRMPTMTDFTRTGKDKPGQPVRSVGGSGHRMGRGAETAVTQGVQNSGGIIPSPNEPAQQNGGSDDDGE